MWIFYLWPIFECVSFFLPRLYIGTTRAFAIYSILMMEIIVCLRVKEKNLHVILNQTRFYN